MRLIDADALKEKVSKQNIADFIAVQSVCDLINKAPTVTVDNYAMGYQDGVRKVLSERPKGEWIDEHKDYLICTHCGKMVYKPFIGGFPTERTQHYSPNFCAFCGADMRGDKYGKS